MVAVLGEEFKKELIAARPLVETAWSVDEFGDLCEQHDLIVRRDSPLPGLDPALTDLCRERIWIGMPGREEYLLVRGSGEPVRLRYSWTLTGRQVLWHQTIDYVPEYNWPLTEIRDEAIMAILGYVPKPYRMTRPVRTYTVHGKLSVTFYGFEFEAERYEDEVDFVADNPWLFNFD